MSDSPQNAAYGLADPLHPELSGFGLSAAALFMVIFGFVWLGWGFSSSPAFTDFSSNRAVPAARWITFYLAFLALLAVTIKMLIRARRRMKTLAIQPDEFRTRFSKRFRAICFFEGAGCALVVGLALGLHRSDLIAAGISVVVGVHFLPLARLFRLPAYSIAGIAIIVADLVSVAMLEGPQITFASGTATGSILWITAIYALLSARGFLREAAAV